MKTISYHLKETTTHAVPTGTEVKSLDAFDLLQMRPSEEFSEVRTELLSDRTLRIQRNYNRIADPDGSSFINFSRSVTEASGTKLYDAGGNVLLHQPHEENQAVMRFEGSEKDVENWGYVADLTVPGPDEIAAFSQQGIQCILHDNGSFSLLDDEYHLEIDPHQKVVYSKHFKEGILQWSKFEKFQEVLPGKLLLRFSVEKIYHNLLRNGVAERTIRKEYLRYEIDGNIYDFNENQIEIKDQKMQPKASGLSIQNFEISVLNKKENIGIYPNPNTGQFQVKLESAQHDGNFKVLDFTGKILQTGPYISGTTIDLNNFPNGNYLFYFENKIMRAYCPFTKN